MQEKHKLQQGIGICGYLCKKRAAAAKIFPHRGQDAAAFIKRIQGVRISDSAVKALKRG